MEKRDDFHNVAIFAIVLITAVFAFIMVFASVNTGFAFQKVKQDKIYVFGNPYAREHKYYVQEKYTPCPPGTVSYSIESRSITAAMDAGRKCQISAVDPQKYCCTGIFYERFDDPLAKYLKE